MVTRAELLAMIKEVKVQSPGEENIVRAPRKRTKRSDFEGNGHWLFPEELGHNGAFGFIYVIRSLVTGKLYLGKKHYVGHGKQNKGVVSNWQWYVSSSKELSAAIQEQGKGSFEFIAIEEYQTRGGLSYAETWSLMFVEAPSRQDRWYNKLVNGVSWNSKEHITARHKARLSMIINDEEFTVEVKE